MKNAKKVLLAVLVAGCGVGWAEPVSQETTEPLNSMIQEGIERIEWGLLLETEGGYVKTGDESESDLILATVEFTLDASVNDWLSGHVGLLWEEDDTEENNLDEGYITIGGGDAFPAYVVVGRYYLPFGNFESSFISDPVTLEMAEINKSSVMAGFDHEWGNLCVGAFKGDDEAVIENFYAAANVQIADVFQAGAYWLSDLLETDGFADLNDDLSQKESGMGAYASFFAGPVTVAAECVCALEGYDVAGKEYTPLAYSIEASLDLGERWTTGIKYEGSNDFYAAFDGTTLGGKLHDEGYGAVVACEFHENAFIAAEYMRLVQDDDADSDCVTLQLAVEL